MDTDFPELTPLELARICRLPEASRLSGVSEDTLKRHHRDKLIEISPRRIGMRVCDALQLSRQKKPAAA